MHKDGLPKGLLFLSTKRSQMWTFLWLQKLWKPPFQSPLLWKDGL